VAATTTPAQAGAPSAAGEATRAAISRAADVLRKGGIVCFPTESFYGLAALAFNDAAVAKIVAVKGRGEQAPIACIAADLEAATRLWAQPVPDVALELARKHWPGSLTLIAPAAPGLPAPLVGANGVGVRVPPHAWALALAAAVEQPITATSANLSGKPPARTVAEVRSQLGIGVDLYLDGGETAGGLPSSIVEIPTRGAPKILRAGAVALSSEEMAWPR
jgi:L-threonylcarbamoyladenylate synthase